MRKFKVLSVAFLAVLAPSSIAVASASGHEWLEDGIRIAAPASVVVNGTWLFLELGFVKVHTVCSVHLVGTVGPGAADEITFAGDLAGKKLASCEVLSTERGLCESLLSLAEFEHLPWKTELLLSIAGQIKDNFVSAGKGAPAIDLRCLLTGGAWSLELCEGKLLTDPLTNGAAGVEGSITNVLLEKCNNAATTYHVFASFTITALNGKKITVD